MDINPGTLQVVTQSLDVRFLNALNAAKAAAVYPLISTPGSSTGSRTIYPLSGDVPMVREWKGNRIAKEVAKTDWVIRNKTWEATIEIPIEDLEDDQIGLYANDAATLGDQIGRHPDKLVLGLFDLGFATPCYDGADYFSTSHPDKSPGGSTLSNKGTTALTADGAGIEALSAAQHSAALIKTDSGEPLDIRYDTIVAPRALEEIANILANNPTIYTGGTTATTNPHAGKFKVITSARLDADSVKNWYLVDSSKPSRPFLFQLRRPIKMTPQIDPQSYPVFNLKKYVWGGDYRGNAGFGLWQFAFGSLVP